MIKLEFETTIKKPVEEVFAFLANPENETKWQPDLLSAKLTSNGPVGVGAEGCDVRKFMGKETVTTWRVTEFVPNRKMTFKVIAGPMPFQGTYDFKSANGGTKLIYRVQAETSGASKLLEPLVSRMVKGQGEKQMTALKQALETDA